MWFLVIAGCASQSRSDDSDPQALGRVIPLPRAPMQSVRVGVEYLPPKESPPKVLRIEAPDFPDQVHGEPSGLIVSSLRKEPPGGEPLEPLTPDTHRSRWDLRPDQISSVKDPIERATMRFLKDLIGEDRRRVERALGSSILSVQERLLVTNVPPNFLDRRNQEDQERLVTEKGPRILRRPLLHALRELPIVADLENVLIEFKKANVPTSGDYQRKNRTRRSWGRLSLRVRSSQKNDPLEVMWIRRGLRIGSSQNKLKVSYSTHMTDHLVLSLWGQYVYDGSDEYLVGNIRYEIDADTTLNAFAGDNIDIFSGPASYPGAPRGDGPSKGILFYVEHLF